MKKNRWIIIIALGIASGLTFLLPFYFKYLFVEFQDKYLISSDSFEQIYIAYGLVALVSYIPSGFLAERYSPKNLIPISLVISGVTGLFTTLNLTFLQLAVIFMIFAASNILLFWVSSIKFILSLGNKFESGRILGVFEGGKGIAGVIFTLLYFFFIVPERMGINFIILVYSVLNILMGMYLWWLLRKVEIKRSAPLKVKKIIKSKKVWAIGGLIFLNYILYSNMVYTNNYLYDLYRFSRVEVVFFACIRIYFLKVVVGPLSGYFVDKLGSALKMFIVTFFIYIFTAIIYISTPSNSELILFIMLNTLVIAILSTVFNTIFFALIPEFDLPTNSKIIGVVSAIGFLPDLFYPIVGKNLINTYGNMAYKYFFLLNITAAIIGLGVSIYSYRYRGRGSMLA